MVGMNSTLTFTPPSVNVSPGGTVQFVFLSKNHSVYQSSFPDPCTPVAGGFKAQFFPITADDTSFPTITLQVNESTPIWFYCPQTNPVVHCEKGMVGAVNPTVNKTFEAFQQTALALGGTTTNGTATPGTNSPGTSTGNSTTGGSTGTSGSGSVAPPASTSNTNGPTTAGSPTGTNSTGNAAFKSGASGFVVALGVVVGSLMAL
jgi:plastocyanin